MPWRGCHVRTYSHVTLMYQGDVGESPESNHDLRSSATKLEASQINDRTSDFALDGGCLTGFRDTRIHLCRGLRAGRTRYTPLPLRYCVECGYPPRIPRDRQRRSSEWTTMNTWMYLHRVCTKSRLSGTHVVALGQLGYRDVSDACSTT